MCLAAPRIPAQTAARAASVDGRDGIIADSWIFPFGIFLCLTTFNPVTLASWCIARDLREQIRRADMVNYRALLTFSCQRTLFIFARCHRLSSEGLWSESAADSSIPRVLLSFATRSAGVANICDADTRTIIFNLASMIISPLSIHLFHPLLDPR